MSDEEKQKEVRCDIFELCQQCSKLNLVDEVAKDVCSKAKIYIAADGSLKEPHSRDKNFNFLQFIFHSIKSKKVQWKDLFNFLWTQVTTFDCLICEQKFSGIDFNECAFHPEEPVKSEESHLEHFPCCESN